MAPEEGAAPGARNLASHIILPGEAEMGSIAVIHQFDAIIGPAVLYKETAQRIDMEAIDTLCELFECELGDLLERVRDSENAEGRR